MVVREMVLKTFAMSTWSTTQLGLASKMAQISWTMASQLFLTTTLNLYGDK
jgi:hypothetical protein